MQMKHKKDEDEDGWDDDDDDDGRGTRDEAEESINSEKKDKKNIILIISLSWIYEKRDDSRRAGLEKMQIKIQTGNETEQERIRGMRR